MLFKGLNRTFDIYICVIIQQSFCLTLVFIIYMNSYIAFNIVFIYLYECVKLAAVCLLSET